MYYKRTFASWLASDVRKRCQYTRHNVSNIWNEDYHFFPMTFFKLFNLFGPVHNLNKFWASVRQVCDLIPTVLEFLII